MGNGRHAYKTEATAMNHDIHLSPSFGSYQLLAFLVSSAHVILKQIPDVRYFVCKYVIAYLYTMRTSRNITSISSSHPIYNNFSHQVWSAPTFPAVSWIHILLTYVSLEIVWVKIRMRSTPWDWSMCLWGFSRARSLLRPYQILPLATHPLKKLGQHFWSSPSGWILLIASAWCYLACFSVLCISCKFIAGSRGLIGFKFNLFGPDCFGVGCASPKLLSGCLSPGCSRRLIHHA